MQILLKENHGKKNAKNALRNKMGSDFFKKSEGKMLAQVFLNSKLASPM